MKLRALSEAVHFVASRLPTGPAAPAAHGAESQAPSAEAPAVSTPWPLRSPAPGIPSEACVRDPDKAGHTSREPHMDSGQLPPRPWGEEPSAPAPPATAAALSPGRALAGERVWGC